MEIKVMSWNIAGAKVLNKLNSSAKNVAVDYIQEYESAWKNVCEYFSANLGDDSSPDIILLQECIGFTDKRISGKPKRKWISGEQILHEIFQDYECFFFPSLSSHQHPHPKKWEKIRAGKELEYLPEYIDVQQGYGICIKNPEKLKRLWEKEPQTEIVDEKLKRKSSYNQDSDSLDTTNYNLAFQAIPISTGLYLGTRDTEPRLAVLGRMKFGDKYLNFINVHLTTLSGEREGKIKINRRASDIRLHQLDQILDFIVSAYQEDVYRIGSNLITEDIWIIGGDFNTVPESREIELVKSLGFVDGNRNNKKLRAPGIRHLDQKVGTKWSISNDKLPPTVLDYIFCGLEKSSFSSGEITVDRSLQPFRPNYEDLSFESDHAVLLSVFEID